MADGRNANGTFAAGNPGGPGRPRRAVEREYLAATFDAIPLDAWRKIVERAVADAQAGDGKAREWLARFVVGAEPPKPSAIAADEADGFTADAEIEQFRRDRAQNRASCKRLLDDLQKALDSA